MNALQAFVKLDVLKGKIEALTRAMEKLELDNNSSNVNVQTEKDYKLLLEMRSELEKDTILNIIHKLIECNALTFCPTLFKQYINIPLKRIFEYLLELVKDKRIDLQWEIRCSNCKNKIKVIETLLDVSEKYKCNNCNSEFDFDLDIMFPVFKINDEYRKYVIKNKKY